MKRINEDLKTDYNEFGTQIKKQDTTKLALQKLTDRFNLSSENVVKVLKLNELRIYLDNIKIDIKGAALLNEILLNEPNLTVLQLSGSIASTKILNYFSNALISNRTLKYLDISNHGSVPGVIKLVKEILLNLHSLKGLGLANNGIEVFKVREICAILKTNTTLIELNLNSNTLGNDGVSLVAEMLNHNTTLKRISLNNNYIKDCGASILSVALGQNTTLNRIDLGSNSITNNSASEVLQSISSNSNYTSLDLSNNDIRDINPSILTSLKMTSSIIHLDLHHNRLEGKIGEIQAQILKNFQAISYFSYFLSNEFKNNQFVIELPSEFRVSQLKYFNKKLFDELHSGKYNSDNEIRNITCNGQNLPRESELDNFVQERFFNLIGVCKGPLKVGGFLVFNEASELIRDELYIPNFIINHITSFLGKGKKCLTSVRIETRKEIEEREAKDFHNSLFGDNDVLIDFNCDSPPIHNNDIILIGQSDHVYTYVYE